MRTNDINRQHLLWLNAECGDMARTIRAILDRMDARGWSKSDPTYRGLHTALSALMAACAAQHELLSVGRDRNYRKATSSGERYRYKLRDQRELGY